MSKNIIYNSTLNPDFWDSENNINPEISAKLLKIANDFCTEVKLPASIIDVYLLGSITNYNWSPSSDVDLHVIIDFNELNIQDKTTAKNYVDSLKSKWNIEHDIKIKNHKVELYIQDVNEKNRSSGVFSLMKSIWIKVPKKEQYNIDKSIIINKFHTYVNKINALQSEPNPDKIKNLIVDLYKMREIGLSSSGEMSNENITFKLLRKHGYMNKLKILKNKAYDKSMSM